MSAAAGSGKTRVLTARFVRLIDELRAAGAPRPLESLIAITFTEKAATELSRRVRGTLAREVGVDVAREAERAWISTIHGLCRRLLKRHAFEAGLDPSFGVCDEVQSKVLRQEAFERAIASPDCSENVKRLVEDYDLLDLEMCVRAVDERLRSLGLLEQDLQPVANELSSALHESQRALRALLDEMLALPGRTPVDEANAESLARLLEAIEPIDAEAGGAGELVLEALTGFTQNGRCRACAKPVVAAAKDEVALLAEAAAAHAAASYDAGFRELLALYADEYELAKRARGLLDFDDLQLEARDLLRAHPELVETYRDALVEVMVDEFQDTNELELSVVSALAGDVLATVGDENQSIYGWRNADIEVFRRRRSEVDEARSFSLPENYRSHPELVSFYNELFSAEPFWPEDFMRLEVGASEPLAGHADACPWPDGASRVQVALLDAADCVETGKTRAEAEAVAAWFLTLKEEGVRQKDLVLLLRAMTNAEVFEAALRGRGFDVFVASGGTFFDTPEVEELKALLKVVANSRDDEALARVLTGRMANLSDDGLYLLRQASRQEGGGRIGLWDAALRTDRPELCASDEARLRLVLDVISDTRREQGRTSLYDLVHSACERLGYDLTLMSAGQPRAWANTLKFARLAGEFERLAPGDVGAFLDHLDMRSRHQRFEQQAAVAAEEIDAVRIMSVHSAKGLEFPVVALAELARGSRGDVCPSFACGLPDGRLTLGVRLPAGNGFEACRDTPRSKSVQEWATRRALDEEKRILYVACTRATDALGMFAVVDREKEVPQDSPIGWVSRALGIAGCDDRGRAEDYELGLGDVSVRVRNLAPDPLLCAEPDESGQVSRANVRQDTPLGDLFESRSDAPPPPLRSRPDRISFTGLKTYLTCPYRYYATYVARLGQPVEPQAANDPLAIGSAVHQALRLSEPTTGLAEEALRAVADNNGLDGEGRARMKAAVERFLSSDLAAQAFAAPRVRRETPFAVDVAGTVLDGAIDLLSASAEEALVVDYKTGTSRPDAETLERWRLQSVCYAIAVFEALPDVLRADVSFFKPELDACETRFAYGRDDLGALKAEVEGIIDRIAGEEFAPLERYEGGCGGCPALGNLCPVSPRPGAGAA